MPKNKTDVQRMLGVLNYLVNTSRTCLSGLQMLIKLHYEFEWTENHMREWKSVVQILSTTPVLAIFDPRNNPR